MQEEGKLQRLKMKWWKDDKEGGGCSDDSAGSGDTPELGMDNVGGVFLVLLCGIAFGWLVAVVQFLWNVRKVAIDSKVHFFPDAE